MSEQKTNADNLASKEQNKSGRIVENISVGGTLPVDAQRVQVAPADIYPSNPALVRNVAQQKYADSWRKFWEFPNEFDPNAFHQVDGDDLLVELPALPDQRHVIEQIIFSLSDDTQAILTITDGQDVIYSQVISMPTNGGWDYLTFSPCRMQRVSNQPLTVSLSPSVGFGTLFVNAWRF